MSRIRLHWWWDDNKVYVLLGAIALACCLSAAWLAFCFYKVVVTKGFVRATLCVVAGVSSRIAFDNLREALSYFRHRKAPSP